MLQRCGRRFGGSTFLRGIVGGTAMDLRNIKLVIEYDGTAYSGWQIQDNAIAVQNMVEEAIFLGTEERVQLIGAGRTDKGVHALGQVANFFTRSQIPADAYRFILKIAF